MATVLSLLVSFASVACATVNSGSHSLALRDSAHRDLVGPYSIDPDTDCAMRQLAYNYSLSLLPDRAPLQPVFDALRLGVDCAMSLSHESPSARPDRVGAYAASYYVDSLHGSDSNAGTEAAPFATLPFAVTAARAGPQPAEVLLRDSAPFHLQSTLQLTAADAGLGLSAFPGEKPLVSGGFPLPGLPWKPYSTPPSGPNITGPVVGSLLAMASGGGCVDAPGAINPGVCAPLGQFANALNCLSACSANATCTGYTWHDTTNGDWSTWCYARLDGDATIDGEGHHFSGYKTAPGVPTTVFSADLSALVAAGLKVPFSQLYVDGRRAVRARWPNANPELQQSPVGYTTAAAWAAPTSYPAPSEVHVDGVRPYDPFFPNFQWGTGGTVANFTSGSFWGTTSPPAGAQFRVPSGLTAGADLLARMAKWQQGNLSHAYLHAFHSGLWGDWAFPLASADATTGDIVFASGGGTQEARGSSSGAGFYVEGILAELDVAGEWYVDAAGPTLYYAVNGTTPPSDLRFIASSLHVIIALNGTSAAPVTGVTVSGLSLSHTAATFGEAFTAPSGGDWSFHNGGAIVFAGTEGCTFTGGTISSVGGSGVMISGHNRDVEVSDSEFVWLGENAIISAGLTGGSVNASSGGEYPSGTRILSNLAHEFGVYVKQSGFYYHGVSASATLAGNVFFNGPRAGINVNDGYFGNHTVTRNCGFNLVRETADHGVFNSWDRQPYFTHADNATDATTRLTTLSSNLFINNYHSSWPIDHDDGSNAYIVQGNFLLWGGSKQYLGFDKQMVGNAYVYADYSPVTSPAVRALRLPSGDVSKYGVGSRGGLQNGWGVCAMAYGTSDFVAPLIDIWRNNTCIVSSSAKAFDFNACHPSSPTDGNIPLLSGNTYLTGDSSYSMKCGGSTWTLAQAQAAGVDVGSTVGPTPALADLVALGHAMLGF